MSAGKEIKWVEIPNKIKTFQLGDYPELIHVIKTGFNDRYMVVFEDAHELRMSEVIYGTKESLEKEYGITL